MMRTIASDDSEERRPTKRCRQFMSYKHKVFDETAMAMRRLQALALRENKDLKTVVLEYVYFMQAVYACSSIGTDFNQSVLAALFSHACALSPKKK